MKQLVLIERFCLIGHVAAMAFGLAGLLLVLPNPEFIASLSPSGQTLFGLSMTGGGVVYIILGAVAVALHAYRTLGLRDLLAFFLPSVCLSLSSELLGTSTGFPFGHYGYLSGLGYKIAGLVPFTIPLSWFYMGMTTYLLARIALEAVGTSPWLQRVGAIAIGSLLLTAWDFVLDPAMSQTPYPFWEFQDPGAFFGMPYRNLSGWLGTGALFMAVATLFWSRRAIAPRRPQMGVLLMIYLVNFAFGAVITVSLLDSQFLIPTAIGSVLGVIPAALLWWLGRSRPISLDVQPLTETTYALLDSTVVQEPSDLDSEAPAVTAGVPSK